MAHPLAAEVPRKNGDRVLPRLQVRRKLDDIDITVRPVRPALERAFEDDELAIDPKPVARVRRDLHGDGGRHRVERERPPIAGERVRQRIFPRARLAGGFGSLGDRLRRCDPPSDAGVRSIDEDEKEYRGRAKEHFRWHRGQIVGGTNLRCNHAEFCLPKVRNLLGCRHDVGSLKTSHSSRSGRT